jgi:voltage-dependent anion channel protein 2
MSPPSFSDLGKKARDIFNDGYKYGLVDLEIKTKSAGGVNLTSTGACTVPDGNVSGDTELKFACKEYGLSFKEKWVTNKGSKYNEDILKSDMTIENKFLDGLRLTFESAYAPASGTRKEKLKASFKNDVSNLSSEVSLSNKLGATAAAVVEYGRFLFGYRNDLKQNPDLGDFAIGFRDEDIEIATSVCNNGSVLNGSVFQIVNPNLITAVSTTWNSATNSTSFALGAKYELDKDAFFLAKIDQASHIGLSHT